MPLASSFESELFCLMNQWKRQAASDYESISVYLLLAKKVDNIFFPNVRELLKILAVLPMGSTEVDEVVFSFSEDPYNDHQIQLVIPAIEGWFEKNYGATPQADDSAFTFGRLKGWLTVSSLLYFCVKGRFIRYDLSARQYQNTNRTCILTPDSKARFCSFATKSDKSLACDTTKNKNLLI